MAKSVILRIVLYFVGPALTVAFGWGAFSVALSFALAGVAALLHVYYRNIYVPFPIFFLRLAAFTAVQLILAAMLRGSLPVSELPVIPQVEEAPAVPMEGKIATDFLQSHPVVTMSIVLPCANEGRFAWKTAESLAAMTPDATLHEIIVVDDGSSPPLVSQFPPEIIEKAKVKFVRHEHHTGLINAKAAGANVATGDIIVFLDCHVKPADNWHAPIVDKIRTNYRRVVVPSITGLDPDNWTEIRGNGGSAKCYLTWDSDFKWFDSDDDYVAVMSGGLLALSRQWWIETGGYDTSMKGWGGENIDQSLRIWLCHGEIVQAKDSFVGHMWRTHDKPETRARYTVPPGSVTINRYRGASVWMGEWSEKLETFPTFNQFKTQKPDVTNIQAVKDRLQCRHFSYFIDKFYKIYHWAGLLPQQVFHLRDAMSGLCLQRGGMEGLLLAQCSDDSAGQRWHRANRDGDKCCSGYRNWNTDQCVVGNWLGSKAKTSVCNIGGMTSEQFVQLNKGTGQLELTKRPGACLGGEMIERQRAEFATCDDTTSFRQQFKSISIDSDALGAPDGAELVRIEDATRPGLCLAALGGTGGAMGKVEVHDCDTKSPLQKFQLKKLENGQTRVAAIGITTGSDNSLCFDAGLNSNEIGLYACYDTDNQNQKVELVNAATGGSFALKFKNNKCVSVSNVDKEDKSLTTPLTLHSCIVDSGLVKRGQYFKKLYPDAGDTTVFAFENRDGNCLSLNSANQFILSKAGCTVHLFKQDPADAQHRLVHVPTGFCFDGNNGITPALYTCYPGDNTNQQIDVAAGYIKLERTETCLDFEPAKSSPVSVIPCSIAETSLRWEEYKPFVPIETKLYNDHKAKTGAELPV